MIAAMASHPVDVNGRLPPSSFSYYILVFLVNAHGYSADGQPGVGNTDGSDKESSRGGRREEGGNSGGGGETTGTMAKCEHCGRPFRKERVGKHEDACKKKMKAIGGRTS